jgi:hypothetical protein
MPWFWSFDFISSMVVVLLNTVVAGAGFEPHEFYSGVSQHRDNSIIFTELAGLSILPLIYLTCLTDRLF